MLNNAAIIFSNGGKNIVIIYIYMCEKRKLSLWQSINIARTFITQYEGLFTNVISPDYYNITDQVDGLKLTNTAGSVEEEEEEGVALDAQFLDVYKGANGIILVLDITKAWWELWN